MPFRRAIAEHVATIMTAHVLAPALDEGCIASLSPRIVQQLLKDELGYDGIVISDDLGMKAVSASTALADATVAAVAAGCDMVLLCNSTIDEQVQALEALIRAAESGLIRPSRIDDAFERQHRVKARVLGGRKRRVPAVDVIGSRRRIWRSRARWPSGSDEPDARGICQVSRRGARRAHRAGCAGQCLSA